MSSANSRLMRSVSGDGLAEAPVVFGRAHPWFSRLAGANGIDFALDDPFVLALLLLVQCLEDIVLEQVGVFLDAA